MLLYVIDAADTIDAAVRRARRNRGRGDVKDSAGRFIFDTVQQRHVIDRAQIVWLTARSGIERRFVENDAETLAGKDAAVDDVSIELEQVWIVVVQPFRFHASSPWRVERGT